LAFVSTVGFDLLPRWVRTFREHYPRVDLELIEATGDVQMQAFERGEIDAGFMLHSPGFAPPGLAVQRIANEKLVLAMPAQGELARKKDLGLKDVLSHPLVIFPRRTVPSLYDAIFAMYHAAGESPRVAQEAMQMQTIVNLVSAELGLAWVPESVQQFKRPGVVYRSMQEGQAATVKAGKGRLTIPTCETSLVWPAARANPVLERFVTFIANTTEVK
jgi:DNA-binding transcriptional LysR family regulator